VPQPASACRMTYRNSQIPLPDCRTTYKAPFSAPGIRNAPLINQDVD
jgi:hypothetical protein